MGAVTVAHDHKNILAVGITEEQDSRAASVAFDFHDVRSAFHERADMPKEAILRGVRDFMRIRVDGDESPAEMRARRRHAELV